MIGVYLIALALMVPAVIVALLVAGRRVGRPLGLPPAALMLIAVAAAATGVFLLMKGL